jgi:hypothetical protein
MSIAAKAGRRTERQHPRGGDLTRHEAAAYVADMLGELKSIANGGRRPHLCCLSPRHGQRSNRQISKGMSSVLGLDQRDELLAVTLQSSREVKFEEHDMDLAGPNPMARMISSISTGLGPRAPTTRSRSLWTISGRGSGAWPSSGAASSGPKGSSGRPRIGAKASTTSLALVTRQAPCFRRLFVPAARESSGFPGTANTSRPCSPASRAVISEPRASTTTTPSEMPEIS